MPYVISRLCRDCCTSAKHFGQEILISTVLRLMTFWTEGVAAATLELQNVMRRSSARSPESRAGWRSRVGFELAVLVC